LQKLKDHGLNDFAYHSAEKQRALLIDAIGACERIQSTPIPFVLAIKTRRFIFLFLLLLPLALIEQVGWATPLITMLTAYPMFCLDEIGIQLQSPFTKENLSHLPLSSICQKIEQNVLALRDYSHTALMSLETTAEKSPILKINP
jgi:putative membrane protein